MSLPARGIHYRRKVNLVYSKCDDEIYPIDELDISDLFYESAAEAAAVVSTNHKVCDLPYFSVMTPKPGFIFKPFRSCYYDVKGEPVFGPLGADDTGMILCADGMGHTVVHDTSCWEGSTTMGMPTMNAPKSLFVTVVPLHRTEAHVAAAAARDPGNNVDLAMEFAVLKRGFDHGAGGPDSLYVMDTKPSDSACPFEVIHFSSSKGWRWHPLPPPPFLRDPAYRHGIDEAVAVDGNTIFISPSSCREKNGHESGTAGTYAFDTVTQEWDKVGEWLLPFMGKAEYVPELKHWFGISRQVPHRFCAVDSLTPSDSRAQHEWADLELLPEDDAWLSHNHCLYLGSGRFCTVKLFVGDDFGPPGYEVPIFTGVEVVRCCDDDDPAQGGPGFKTIKHKSMQLSHDQERTIVI